MHRLHPRRRHPLLEAIAGIAPCTGDAAAATELFVALALDGFRAELARAAPLQSHADKSARGGATAAAPDPLTPERTPPRRALESISPRARGNSARALGPVSPAELTVPARGRACSRLPSESWTTEARTLPPWALNGRAFVDPPHGVHGIRDSREDGQGKGVAVPP